MTTRSQVPNGASSTSNDHDVEDNNNMNTNDVCSQDFIIEALKGGGDNDDDDDERPSQTYQQDRSSSHSNSKSPCHSRASSKSPTRDSQCSDNSKSLNITELQQNGSSSDDENNGVGGKRRRPRKPSPESTSGMHQSSGAVSSDAQNSTAQDTAASRATSYFSTGQDFYDDGYSDDEHGSEQSIADRLDWTGAMTCCKLQSRQKALRELVKLYETIYQESVQLEEQEQRQEKEETQRRQKMSQQHDAVLLQQKETAAATSTSLHGNNAMNDTDTTKETMETTAASPNIMAKKNSSNTKPKKRKASSSSNTTKSISKSIAIIRGKSGTGKSTLVQQFMDAMTILEGKDNEGSTCTSKPYFLSGKYTQEKGHGQPLSALVQAFEGFLQSVLEKGDDVERQRLRTRIQEQVLDDKHDDNGDNDNENEHHNILLSLLPSLRALLHHDGENDNGHHSFKENPIKQDISSHEFTTETSHMDHHEEGMPQKTSRIPATTHSQDTTDSHTFLQNVDNNANALNQLVYVFGVFCKALATRQTPIVLFLDDLQWCDVTSRQVLQNLLTDPSLKYVLFVGAVRHDVAETADESNDSCLTPLSHSIGGNTGTTTTTGSDTAAANANAAETMEWLAQLESKSVDIHVGNLSLDELTQFVAAALKMNPEDDEDDAGFAEPDVDDPLQQLREELVQVIYSKTRGNIFFSKQILEQMHREGLLEFSRMTFQWEWNLDGVNLDDRLSSDVLHAVTAKLNTLSPILQHALTVAAYTKATFDIDTLFFLLHDCNLSSAMELNVSSQDGLVKILDSAVLEGLLSNSTGSKNYSFEHDRIQQAAFGLVPKGQQRDSLRLKMGQGMVRLATGGFNESSGGSILDALDRISVDKEWLLFVAADHMNASSLQYQMQRESVSSPATIDPLTALNCHVGYLAANKAAYETASNYLMLAKQQLLRTCKELWNSQYTITLKIFSKLVDVELWRGNYIAAQSIAKHLLTNARTAEDRLPTQLALAKAYGREEKHAESLQNAVSALRALQVYPKGPVCKYAGLAKNLLFVKRFLNKKRDEEIVYMPLMTDQRYLMAMEFLSVGSYQAYYLGNEIEFVVLAMKMLRLTIKYGLCGQSGVALIGYALICNNLNDMEGAHRFSALSRQVLERTKAKHLEPIQLLVVAHWITGWSDPHPKVLSVFERGYRSGMESGDFENALLNMTAGYHHEYAAGYPLTILDMKYEQLVQRLNLYKIHSVLVMSEEQWRKIKHLMGRNPGGNPLDVKELSKFGPEQKRDGSEKYRLLYGYLCRLELAVYFGDLEFAAEMAVKTLENDSDNSFTTNSLRLYFSGLTYATLARTTGKRSYRRKARGCYKEFKKLCDIKGLNSWHRAMVLEAQWKTLDGKEDSRVEATYDRAVQCAMSSGHIQDAALACQLAAEYFSSLSKRRTEGGSIDSAEFGKSRKSLVTKYLDQSRQLYFQWGAHRLIRHLEEKYDVAPLPRSMCDTASSASHSLMTTSKRSSNAGLPTSSSSVISGIDHAGSNAYLSVPQHGIDGMGIGGHHHSGRSGGLPVISDRDNSDSKASSSNHQQLHGSDRTPPLLEEHDNISVMTDQWKDSGQK